jgi:Flp pilus assembly protein RcpC/CpaB
VEGVLLISLAFSLASGSLVPMSRAIVVVILAAALSSHCAFGQASKNALKIPEGMRAVAISRNSIPVGASVKPGDRVDLLATYVDPRTRQEVTKMIMQNVLVLAVDKSVTLGTTPEQVELVAAADRAGALRISPRAAGDQQIPSGQAIFRRNFGIVTGEMAEVDVDQLRDLALKYLRDRYPNIDSSHFVFQRAISQSGGKLTVVFAERDSASYQSNQVIYAIQYLVRLKPDGELIDIQQQVRYDGILKISPTSDQP